MKSTPPIVYILDLSAPLRALGGGADYAAPFAAPPAAHALRRHWEEVHLAVCLQGLANRHGPRLWLRYHDRHDDFWLARLVEDGWLREARFEHLDSLHEAAEVFRDVYRGAVLWDPAVPATSNLASTLAGVEDLLAVRGDPAPGSLAREVLEEWGVPVVIDLARVADGGPFNGAQSGSAKNDAYRWLIDEYIKPGKTNAEFLGYYIDAHWLQSAHCGWPGNHTLTNHDFLIARRGVLFDLHVYGHEPPVDDPRQPLGRDEEMLKQLLLACHAHLPDDRLMHVAGFVPWRYKYTNCHERGWNAGGDRGAVDVEWRCTQLLSSYDAYLDADALDYAAMTNASFFQHFPLPDRLAQGAPPTCAGLVAKGLLDGAGKVKPINYVSHYVGDYDAAAWLYWNMPRLWNDRHRGELPLTWAFNPTLAVRFPYCLAWTRASRTLNDSFAAGDNGAGYLNPANLVEPRPESGLPSGVARWEAHNRRDFRQWDLDAVGFIIDGHTGTMGREAWDAYARIAPGGFAFHRHAEAGGMHGGVPWLRYMGDLPMGEENDAAAAEQIRAAMQPGGPHFLLFRSVLQSPTFYVNVDRRLRETAPHPWALVDLRTLLLLKKLAETTKG